MDRRSQEEVDAALATERADQWSFETLAAEVRALRKEFGECEAEFRAPLRAELSECRAQLDKARADVVSASGELLVEVPEPGTDMSRVMIANALMRRERNLFRDASEAAELRVVELRAQIESKNAALKCAHEALNEDVIVRTMHYPDGRIERTLSSEFEAEIEVLRLVELRAAANEYRDQSDQLDHAIEECAHYKEGYEREEGAARAYRAQVGVLCATIARVEAFIPKLKTRAQELRDTHYEYCAASEIVDAADEIEDALRGEP
jgi:AraC-like DNA-binding protein